MSDYLKQAQDIYAEEQQELKSAEDEDQWDKRINNTGCYVENLALQLCHADTNDWRECLGEMQAFKECWQQNGNNDRVNTVNK